MMAVGKLLLGHRRQTMWLMILIVVHLKDPKDIPGRVMLEFPDQLSCETSLQSMTYWIKFDSFRIEGKCIKNETK